MDDRWLEQFIDYGFKSAKDNASFIFETGAGMTSLMLRREAQHWRQIYYEQKEPDKTGIIFWTNLNLINIQ